MTVIWYYIAVFLAGLRKIKLLPGGPSDQILDLFGPGLDAGGKPEHLKITFKSYSSRYTNQM